MELFNFLNKNLLNIFAHLQRPGFRKSCLFSLYCSAARTSKQYLNVVLHLILTERNRIYIPSVAKKNNENRREVITTLGMLN